MNEMKAMVMDLDGYSFDKTGYEVLSAIKIKDMGSSTYHWSIEVAPFVKEDTEGGFCEQSRESMAEAITRLETDYRSKMTWKIVSATVCEDGTYSIVMETGKVSKKTEEKQ